jgi:tripartite-type tricarboxylate transporter receptor subunit TctC
MIHLQSSLRMLAVALACVAGLAQMPASAQSYPSQPIKIVVSTPAGGIADLLARTLAQKLNEAGKTTIVENRTGGGGTIGADAVAKSAPDGYTLYMGFHATQSILPHLMAKMPYDALKDFAPIILIGTSPNVLIVHPSVPAKTPMELVAFAKANPGKLTYASQGIGSSGHLAGELFRLSNGIDVTHVPYRGAAPALQDLVAGQVDMVFDILPLAKEQIEIGKVRPLGVTSQDRSPIIPNVPTMTEAGMPDVVGGPWFGLLAPAATPRAAIDWINAEAKKAFAVPEIRDRLTGQGINLPLGSPEDFAKHIADESERWGGVIRRANLKLSQ